WNLPIASARPRAGNHDGGRSYREISGGGKFFGRWELGAAVCTTPSSQMSHAPPIRIDPRAPFLGNVAGKPAGIFGMSGLGPGQHVVDRVPHEQLLAGDANELAPAGVHFRGVRLQPGPVPVEALLT